MDENTPLHAAARHRNVVAVKVLLQFKFDPYAKDRNGRLPIHLAAEEGHFKLVVLSHKLRVTVSLMIIMLSETLFSFIGLCWNSFITIPD